MSHLLSSAKGRRGSAHRNSACSALCIMIFCIFMQYFLHFAICCVKFKWCLAKLANTPSSLFSSDIANEHGDCSQLVEDCYQCHCPLFDQQHRQQKSWVLLIDMERAPKLVAIIICHCPLLDQHYSQKKRVWIANQYGDCPQIAVQSILAEESNELHFI